MFTPTLQQVISHTKAYGFLFNSSEIYGNLHAVYDYGPFGVLLKRKIQAFWWKSMTQLHPNIVDFDAAILMHPTVWEASGHLAGFHDWMVDNKDSQKRYRIDTLIEEKAAVWKASGRPAEAQSLLNQMHVLLTESNGTALSKLLTQTNIICPISKTNNWTEAKEFNLMFSTQAEATASNKNTLYLRPETAQGIFVNFLNLQKTARMQLPFGIAQIGKAFRNELIARQFIFRMREFEQMEMQFFIPPDDEKQWFNHWTQSRKCWYETLGIPTTDIRVKPHKQLAHYAAAAVDLEYTFPFGFQEVEGIHARTNFDLTAHAKHAKKKITYFDPKQETSYVPHIIETSAGCDRVILMLLCHALRQTTEKQGNRTYLAFPPPLAPIGAAILPLLKTPPLVEAAKALFNTLRFDFSLRYEERGSIGKRYTQQDLIGTPYCITIDHQTLKDQQVTLRHRDTMEQNRIPITELHTYLTTHLSMSTLLKKFETISAAKA